MSSQTRTPTYSGADSLRARGLGVSMDCPVKCRMCEAHEVREIQQRNEISDGAELAEWLATNLGMAETESAAWRVVARDWRQRLYLSITALGLVFIGVVAGWIR